MNTPQPVPLSYQDRALELLNTLRQSVESGDITNSAEQLGRLTRLLNDWQKTEVISRAREWFNDALQGELLTFNVEVARTHLKNWRATLNEGEDSAELDDYQRQIEDFIRRKARALEIRGVMAHCDELLAKGHELERSEAPPKPAFVLSNYYQKALDIAQAARNSQQKDAELDILIQKIERLLAHKQSALNIYKSALQDERYVSALADLESLPPDMLVPRFVLGEDTAGKRALNFHSMLGIAAAREEILTLATAWAQKQAQNAISQANTQLHNHQPQSALAAFDALESYQNFLTPTDKQTITELQTRAQNEIRQWERAEKFCEQATALVEEDPLGAWNTYVEAYNTYQWAPSLAPTREAVIKGLRTELEGAIIQAETAFNNKDMERVRHIVANAQYLYTSKDPSLDELLQRLTDFNDLADQYETYIQNATETMGQIRDILWRDAVAANDLLSQLESYPDIILDAFPDLPNLRAKVNERLNADSDYNQLYTQLFADDIVSVREALQEAQNAAQIYEDDTRFPALIRALDVHLIFLNAKLQQAAGKVTKAVELLQQVAAADNHPDQDDAIALLDQLGGETA